MSKIKNNNSIVCVVAHPDDEALGIGGVLIKHVNNGDKVNIIILSKGEDSKNNKEKNKNRTMHAYDWSKFIGANLYKLFDFPDQKLDTIPKLTIIVELEKIFKDLNPSVVYTHHAGDINHDHQIVSHAVLTALRPMNKNNVKSEIRTFETLPSSDQSPYIEPYLFKPNFYVSIENEWKKKIAALKIYEKEVGQLPHPRFLKAIEALAIKRGAESNYKKAEAIQIIRKFWE